MSELTLDQEYFAVEKRGRIEVKIPNHITQNLNPQIALRPYQEQALSRFFDYLNNPQSSKKPVHLLFNMATGSGKTVVMAAAILQLYFQGYRNFLFFVNSSNILQKTRQNFLQNLSQKYLFNHSLKFGEKSVKIREVSNFESANPDEINICFTTIQALHGALNNPKENSLTYEDFSDKKIAIISDEAHHINSLTKKPNLLGKDEQKDLTSWENTVMKILQSNLQNQLLEFTATIDLKNPNIAAKYADKIIFTYDLKKFRQDGYSKDIFVLSSDLSAIDRALQAIIISQFRKKIAQKIGGFDLKPVILFKSKNIDPSEKFRQEFHQMLENLSAAQIEKIEKNSAKKFHKEKNILSDAFEFFAAEKITFENLIEELRDDFSASKTININDKSEAEENQILINSLEDKSNPIRAIFAVDKLNEGWDVLNLFDIVRLYETRDSGKSTNAEAQLIGRGARYFPFKINDNQEKFKRKFDQDFTNKLKVLEELHYHCISESRYVSEIKKALIESGIMEEVKIERQLKIKDKFKETDFYQNGLIFLNRKITNQRENILGLKDYKILNPIKGFKINNGNVLQDKVFANDLTLKSEIGTDKIKLAKISSNLIRSEIDKLDFFKFENLQKHFPKYKSQNDFFLELKAIEVEVTGDLLEIKNLSAKEKAKIVFYALEEIKKNIEAKSFDYQGTKEFKPKMLKEILQDKTLKFAISANSSEQELGKSFLDISSKFRDFGIDLNSKDWYVHNDNFGTLEEKNFIKFLNDKAIKLKEIYAEFYLLRNEKYSDLFNFSDGRKIEPDFVLFLKKKQQKKILIYQLFIEPKGEQLFSTDSWKSDFLTEIKARAKVETVFQNKEYEIHGLPFYNEKITKREFENSLNQILETFS
jgi:type III restriction enzyme